MESFLYGLAAIMITIGFVSLCSCIKAFVKKKLRGNHGKKADEKTYQ